MVVILVIDADAAVRLAARRVLESAGFNVSEAAGPGLGCATPDLVIADLAAVRPQTLRSMHPRAGVLTLSEAADAGGLRKPFTASQLLAAVRLRLARRGRGMT